MAKLSSPLFSKTASGSIAGLLTYSERKSGSQVRYQRRPADNPTTDRLIQRQAYLAAVEGWNALTDEQKAVWKTNAKGLQMTGYNLYIRDNTVSYLSYYGVGVYGVSIYGNI